MSESLIATILVVFVLTICLLYIIFMIGFYYGKHTIDHEFHSELMMLRNEKLDNSKKISDEDL